MPTLGKTTGKLFIYFFLSIIFLCRFLPIETVLIHIVLFPQVQGLGTALKILYSGKFDEDIDYTEDQPKNIRESLRQRFKLKRGEIVSLFNAFGRYIYFFNTIVLGVLFPLKMDLYAWLFYETHTFLRLLRFFSYSHTLLIIE